MKKIIKQFYKDYFLSVGLVSVSILIPYHIIPKLSAEKAIKILGVMMIAMIPISLSGAILFRNIETKKELWIRRAVLVAICCISYPMNFILFNVVKEETVWQYVFFIFDNMVLICISVFVSYLIMDKIEQKKIEKINNKLNDMK